MNMLRQTSSVSQTNPSSIIGETNIIDGIFTNRRIMVQSGTSNSGWQQDLESRFNELTSLKLGWDGYEGLPITFTCAYFAAQLLKSIYSERVSAPSLVPGSDGTLQIEWHENNYGIEIDVLDANNVIASRHNLTTNTEETIELKNDFTILVDWINELSSEREIPQQNLA